MKTSDQGDISRSDAFRIVGLWASENLQNIRFSGGEPTLWEDLVELVKYTKKRGVKRIAVSTNGSACYEYYMELVNAGVNDFSISLDSCCASTGNKMAGRENIFSKIISNITNLSKISYVTVGVVLTEENDLQDRHPILKYRFNNFANAMGVRGLPETDNYRCPLVLDDMAVLNGHHYPCIIYMREHGNPIGKINGNIKTVRAERLEWFEGHNSFSDSICKENCLDVCIDYNNRVRDLNEGVATYDLSCMRA